MKIGRHDCVATFTSQAQFTGPFEPSPIPPNAEGTRSSVWHLHSSLSCIPNAPLRQDAPLAA